MGVLRNAKAGLLKLKRKVKGVISKRNAVAARYTSGKKVSDSDAKYIRKHNTLVGAASGALIAPSLGKNMVAGAVVGGAAGYGLTRADQALDKLRRNRKAAKLKKMRAKK